MGEVSFRQLGEDSKRRQETHLPIEQICAYFDLLGELVDVDARAVRGHELWHAHIHEG